VAMVSWHAFEKPINNLKDRFTYAAKRPSGRLAGKPTSADPLALPEA